jgi:ABC-type Mn2+/Zn2+ transport system permease subunit
MSLFSPDFLFRNALAGGLLVGVLCGVLGVYVVLRRFALLGVALPQASAAGIAFTFLATRHQHAAGAGTHVLALLGSVGFTFAGLALLTLSGRRSRIPEDGRIGALLAVASAGTVLFVAANPAGDFEVTSLLRGELLAISDTDLVVLATASLVTGVLFLLFRREILLASFDPDFARTLGKSPVNADALLYVLLGIAISLGVMTVGPLVVFGFLTLPALCALRIAPRLGVAFALAALVAAVSSLGGFAIAYRADLPAGPVDVALAAALWLAASGVARLRESSARRTALRSAALAAVFLLAGVALGGCAEHEEPEEAPAAGALLPLSRGTLPASQRPIAVLRFRNETGESLRIASNNPLEELGKAAGDPFARRDPTVLDQLAEIATQELARRGFVVLSMAEAEKAVPKAPSDPGSAALAAKRAGLDALVLQGTLRRFTLNPSRVLLITLDLALVDPRDGRTLWTGTAHRPVAVTAAQTLPEAVRDAGPRIFADAFGGG